MTILEDVPLSARMNMVGFTYTEQMRAWVEEQIGDPIYCIFGFEENLKQSGGCSTCSFEYYVMTIWYLDKNKNIVSDDFVVEFEDLVISLSQVNPFHND